jgi:RNA-directed DNA polymerase
MPYITYLTKSKVTKSATTLAQISQAILNVAPSAIVRKTKTVKVNSTEATDHMLMSMGFLEDQLKTYNHTYEGTKKDHFEIFQIPKATGGFRTIKAPDKDLKERYSSILYNLQHQINLKAHEAAFAYVPAKSTKHAVQQHQQNNSMFFLKVDIKGFFDNCSEELVIRQLDQIFPLNHNPTLVRELAKFAALDDGLPQGTPLSPFLTNLIMIPFDYEMASLAEQWNFVYTRYADDILISKVDGFRFKDITGKIEKYFVKLDYPFELKNEKTRYGNRNGNNWNLGLMLNKDNKITLGHELKHRLKCILFQISQGELVSNDPSIIGLFNYLHDIEPEYYEGLNRFCGRKYRREITDLINP